MFLVTNENMGLCLYILKTEPEIMKDNIFVAVMLQHKFETQFWDENDEMKTLQD